MGPAVTPVAVGVIAVHERSKGEGLEPAGIEQAAPGAIPRGEDHRDLVRAEPAGAEEEGIRRRLVQPVGVVDHAQHQVLLRGVGQQGQGRHADQEGFDRGPFLFAERHA